ncbi:hypothetical protein NL676_014606 [Syzygium grande]|nr:hypothetical protein NL676_014606 [Syzygium grande]
MTVQPASLARRRIEAAASLARRRARLARKSGGGLARRPASSPGPRLARPSIRTGSNRFWRNGRNRTASGCSVRFILNPPNGTAVPGERSVQTAGHPYGCLGASQP